MPTSKQTPSKKTSSKAEPVKAEPVKEKLVKAVPVPVPVPVPEPVQEPVQEQSGGKKDVRYFKVTIDGCKPRGRYCGSKPKQAAIKALTSIVKEKAKAKQNTKGKFKFTIIECTRGRKHKQYNYIGER